jgi:hypothetical protein
VDVAQTGGVGKDGERISFERRLREDVDDEVAVGRQNG